MNPRAPLETRPGRMRPLARLPLFHDLAGRRVLLVGGSDAAAWKAELLAAAGCDLHVVAENVGPEMRAVASDPPAGAITLHERAWTDADFTGVALAIGAIEDDEEGARFAAAGRATHVPVNVVDKPGLCDFAFGAIVNRSPLVIGVSTDGAAPVFGQMIRAKLEAMLPRGFASWAAAAKAWRPAVQAVGLDFARRRRFWERFTQHALKSPNDAPDEATQRALLAQSAREAASPTRGAVTLVGAGPGDAELLTLKAVRALQSADVVLYDDLVSRDVLEFARREAKTMLVGKTGHQPSCRQDDINALMIGLAQRGKQVVRLKSGDPLIFGRAGEEIEACRKAGVDVAVVPGVSAAQGAAAALSLSLTHRDSARRVQFVTGHEKTGALPDDLDGATLADPAATTVVYMPRRTCRDLAARAIAAGLPPETPALAIVDATRPTQRVIAATIATLADAIADAPDGPMLVMIGNQMREAAPVAIRVDEAPQAQRAG